MSVFVQKLSPLLLHQRDAMSATFPFANKTDVNLDDKGMYEILILKIRIVNDHNKCTQAYFTYFISWYFKISQRNKNQNSLSIYFFILGYIFLTLAANFKCILESIFIHFWNVKDVKEEKKFLH